MVWFLVACAAAVLGLAAVAGSGRFGALPPPVHDTPVLDLPMGVLTGDDLRGIRFAGGLRGYAPAQVDEVLGRLAAQLDAAAPGSAVPEPAVPESAVPPSSVGESAVGESAVGESAVPEPAGLVTVAPDRVEAAAGPAGEDVGPTDPEGLR